MFIEKNAQEQLKKDRASIKLLFTFAVTYSPAMATGMLANSHKNASVYTHPQGNFVTFFISTGFPCFLFPNYGTLKFKKHLSFSCRQCLKE